MILVDTNVLARSLENQHIHQLPALDAMRRLRVERGEEIVVAPQVLTELYAACTRTKNGLGFSAEKAMQEIDAIKLRCPLCADTPDIFPQWEALAAKYKPRNRQVFDMRLVALMMVYDVRQLLTFNDKDFLQFSEVQVLNPFDVLGISRV